ncbi:MAG: TonB-dependent receptor, partial [Pseudomonadota bacterium]
AAISAGIAFSSSVTAQNTNGADNEIEEIQVTGSRIRQTDGMAAPTPVTVVTPAELSNFEPGGTVAEQLDALPQFFGTQTAQRGGLALSGDAGASFLNMRSLGTNRTLVLLDGARMAPADKRGSVNVDTFPTALVRTVDIVTGGASAAYGADALGGVTNFIIDREFEGLKVSTGTGLMENGDGFRWNASIAGGKQFGDRLNVIGSFENRFIEQIITDPEDLDTDWYQRWGHVTNPAWAAAAALPAGNPNRCVVNVRCAAGPQRLTMPWIAPTETHVYGVISGVGNPAFDGSHFNREGSAIVPFADGNLTSKSGPGTTRSTSGGPESVLAHQAYAGPGNGAEVVGRSLFLAAKYDVTDDLSVYGQAVVGRSESNQDPNRADLMGINLTSIWAPLVAVDNAYLPTNLRDAMVARNIKEFTLNRSGAFIDQADMGIDQRDENIFTTETYTLGFNYALPFEWDLSGNYSSGQTKRLSSVDNMMRVDRMFLAMDAVRDPKNGAIVCRVQLVNPTVAQLNAAGLASGRTNDRVKPEPPLKSPIGLDNTINDCVPYNVMGFGNISREAIDYVGTLKESIGLVDQDFAEILATGEIYEGWGYGALSMAAGLTWRESSFSDGAFPIEIDELGPPFNVPELGIRGIPAGYSSGSPNLHQFSTVPLISGEFNVWEWFSELQVPIWESTSGAQSLGGSVAYRSSDYNLSGRSESWKLGIEVDVIEGLRFRATKSRDVREASFSERFDSQGGGGNVTDPTLGISVPTTVVASGNPSLRPEVADTLVAGVVYEPSWAWAEGLSISTDWYSVDIADSIEQIAAQDVVDRCFFGDSEQCANVIRDPSTNSISSIIRRFFNVAQDKVEGVDLEVSYRIEPNFFADKEESFSVRALSGYLMTREDVSGAGLKTNRLGQYTTPNVTANLTFNYGVGPYSFQMQGRFIDGGKLNRIWEEGREVDDNWVASSTWWNGRIGYRGELESGANWNLGLSIQNMFDTHPPIIPGGTAGAQTVNGQYDEFGRRYAVSLDMTF